MKTNKEKRDFVQYWFKLHIKSEEDAILYLVKFFNAIGGEVLSYRSTLEKRNHSGLEEGKDIVVKFNSFLQYHIGIQVKYQKSGETSVTDMGKYINQLNKALAFPYRGDHSNKNIEKAYLLIFGEVNNDARRYFNCEKNNRNEQIQLVTMNSLEELAVNYWHLLYPKIWSSEYLEWEDNIRLNLVAKLKNVTSGSIVYKSFLGKELEYEKKELPKQGFFLDPYSEEFAAGYFGYTDKLKFLASCIYKNISTKKKERLPVF